MLIQLLKENQPMLMSSEDIYIPSKRQSLDEYLNSINTDYESDIQKLKEQDLASLALLIEQEQKKSTEQFNQIINFLVQKYPNDFPYWELYQWSNIPDSCIAAVLQAHYSGVVDISNYWQVGDERVYTLYSPPDWQNKRSILGYIHFVILDFNKDQLVTSISGITKSAITLGIYYSGTIDGVPMYSCTHQYRTETTNAFPSSYTGLWTPYANSRYCYLALYDTVTGNNNNQTLIDNGFFTIYNLIKEVVKQTRSQNGILTTEDLVFPLSFSEMLGDLSQISGEEQVYQLFLGSNEKSIQKIKTLFQHIDGYDIAYDYGTSHTSFIRNHHDQPHLSAIYAGYNPLSIRSNCINTSIEKEMAAIRDTKNNVGFYLEDARYGDYYDRGFKFADRGYYNFLVCNI